LAGFFCHPLIFAQKQRGGIFSPPWIFAQNLGVKPKKAKFPTLPISFVPYDSEKKKNTLLQFLG
jgi:hypothetical protein